MNSIKSSLPNILDRLQPSETTVLIVALTRYEQAIQMADVMRNINDAQAIIVDITLTNSYWSVGKTVSEIQLPLPAIFVSIQRGRQLLIPHGDTQLLAGNIVTTLRERECQDKVKSALISGGD